MQVYIPINWQNAEKEHQAKIAKYPEYSHRFAYNICFEIYEANLQREKKDKYKIHNKYVSVDENKLVHINPSCSLNQVGQVQHVGEEGQEMVRSSLT